MSLCSLIVIWSCLICSTSSALLLLFSCSRSILDCSCSWYFISCFFWYFSSYEILCVYDICYFFNWNNSSLTFISSWCWSLLRFFIFSLSASQCPFDFSNLLMVISNLWIDWLSLRIYAFCSLIKVFYRSCSCLCFSLSYSWLCFRFLHLSCSSSRSCFRLVFSVCNSAIWFSCPTITNFNSSIVWWRSFI